MFKKYVCNENRTKNESYDSNLAENLKIKCNLNLEYRKVTLKGL